MKTLIITSAVAILAILPTTNAHAEEELSVRSQPAAPIDRQAEADDLVEKRVQEKREILDRKEEQARGLSESRIQSFDNEVQKGMQATATTRIDMR